jgi:cholesterol transport system auxiliary component
MVIRHAMRLLLIALLLNGCVGLGKSYPEKQYYALDTVREGGKLPSVPGTVLKIRKFRILPAFEGKGFVYRLGAARYETDFYNEWFILPDAMFTQQALNWFAAADLFQYVLDAAGPLPATHILEGIVTALYGDYRSTPNKAILGFQFLLVHETAGSTQIIWHKEYRKEVEVMGQSPEALVSGWNAALRIILTAVEADLSQAFAGG